MDVLIISDVGSLTLDDLQEEYKKLFSYYQNLIKSHDDDLQQIFELHRNLKIAKAAEEHLIQELDIVLSSQNLNLEKQLKKLNQELEEYKKKIIDLEDYNYDLEKKLDLMNAENEKLQKQLLDVTALLNRENLDQAKSNEYFEVKQKLEDENMELLGKLNELQQELSKYYMVKAEKDKQIEILNEEIQCYEENLNAKRTEVEEKSSTIESLQERIVEMNNELASLKLQPENENRKGNSLFAEVDDQRQAMRSQLLAQKKCYLQMKKIYNESQYEIRRLKRENSAIQSEIQTCSSIFLNSKKFYEDKLIQKISFLSKENCDLEKKLNVNQERLLSLAENNDVTWLDSIMKFCTNETKELKIKLQNIRLQKGIIEKNYRDSQEELAKWRLEALKSRCIIIDREALLDENSIKYKNIHEMNVNIKEEDSSQSSPQILCMVKDLKNKGEEQTELQNSDVSTVIEDGLHFDKEKFCSTFFSRNTDIPDTLTAEAIFTQSNKVDVSHKIDFDKKFNKSINNINSDININLDKLKAEGVIKMENNNLFESDNYQLFAKDHVHKIDEYKILKDAICLSKKSYHTDVDNGKDNPKPKTLALSNPAVYDKENRLQLSNESNQKTKNQDSKTMKVITKTTKSNITIKKIIIKSKEEKP